ALVALEKRFPRVPRPVLAVGIFVGAAGLLVGLVFLLVPRVEEEVERLKSQANKYRDSVVSVVESAKAKFPGVARQLDPESALVRFQQFPWKYAKSQGDLVRLDPEVAAVVRSDVQLDRMRQSDWTRMRPL